MEIKKRNFETNTVTYDDKEEPVKVWVLYGDIFSEGNTAIIGLYTSFDKAKNAYFNAKQIGYFNIQDTVKILDKELAGYV